MRSMIDSASLLQEIITKWITNSVESGLDKAIYGTFQNHFFPESDVQFAVNQLKRSVQNNEMVAWATKVCSHYHDTSDSALIDYSNRRILCLHAGNLPLVGLQDALAVLLSGAQYFGKISRKDPLLLPSLFEFIKKNTPDFNINYSTNIADFNNSKIQEWMFAGSESSLENLKNALERDLIIHPAAHRSLIRIAHFSVAKIDRWDEQICNDLIDSILRYNGKGCRSVGIVYSTYKLSELADQLNDAGSHWVLQNDYPIERSPRIKIRSAYNDALGIDQVSVGNKIIQEGVVTIDDADIVYWQPEADLNRINELYGKHLQQVYLTNRNDGDESNLLVTNKCDFLHKAQSPPIWWQPDGIDVLKWIIDKNYGS